MSRFRESEQVLPTRNRAMTVVAQNAKNGGENVIFCESTLAIPGQPSTPNNWSSLVALLDIRSRHPVTEIQYKEGSMLMDKRKIVTLAAVCAIVLRVVA